MSALQRQPSVARKSSARMRKADRRQQLLRHAKQLFVSLGYQATTTEKIAGAASVSEPVLYRHFDSKKALFLEVLREIRSATLERWQAENAKLEDPVAKLHALAEIYLGAAREHAVELRIMHRTLVETDDAEIVAVLRSFYLESEAMLAEVILEGQQTGVFRRTLDPRVGAWEFIRSALGYTLTAPLGVPLYEEPDYLPRAIDCLLHSLLKTDV